MRRVGSQLFVVQHAERRAPRPLRVRGVQVLEDLDLSRPEDRVGQVAVARLPRRYRLRRRHGRA